MPSGLDPPVQQPQISAIYVRILLDYLRDRASVDPEVFLSGLNLSGELVADEDSMVPTATFLLLMEEAAAFIEDPDLGLHYYENFDFRAMGVLGYAILNARVLGEALLQVSRYYCLFQTDTEIKLSRHRGLAEFSYQITAKSLPYSRQDSEMTIAAFIAMARIFLGEDWCPDRVSFQHARPADISEHLRLLGPEPLFNQTVNAISFPERLLDATVDSADTRLNQSLASTFEQLLSMRQLPSENDWLKGLQEHIIDLLSEGVPAIEEIASQLNVSSRTLQRKLLKEGIGYRDLVENIRHQLASNYLTASELSTQDIAFLLGYSELSSFNRAFKRWTGQSPAEFRKSNRLR